MRRIVIFSISAWVISLALVAIGMFFMCDGIIQQSPIAIVGGFAGIAIGVVVCNLMGGFIINKKNEVIVKQILSKKYSVVSKESITKLCVSEQKFNYQKRDFSRTNLIRANSSKGPAMGAGMWVLRALVNDLNVPVDLQVIPLNILPLSKFLLQKGQLTRVKAERLKEKFHIPQKFFDKWYVEPKQ